MKLVLMELQRGSIRVSSKQVDVIGRAAASLMVMPSVHNGRRLGGRVYSFSESDADRREG